MADRPAAEIATTWENSFYSKSNAKWTLILCIVVDRKKGCIQLKPQYKRQMV